MPRFAIGFLALTLLVVGASAQITTLGPLPDNIGAGTVRNLVVVSPDTILFCATPQINSVFRNRVYRTVNAGQTWSVVFDTTYTMEIRMTKSRSALIATYNGNVIRSTNSGTTWSAPAPWVA